VSSSEIAFSRLLVADDFTLVVADAAVVSTDGAKARSESAIGAGGAIELGETFSGAGAGAGVEAGAGTVECAGVGATAFGVWIKKRLG